MKVSIVEPKAPFYNFFSSYIKHLPLLGPIYLATILKQNGHDVTVHNCNFQNIDYSTLKDTDVLGLSTLTSTAPAAYEIARNYRAINPQGRIIIGGAHATFLPEEAAEFADHIVTGEAEEVIADVVEYGGDKIIPGGPIENLDQLPFPDFSLVPGFTRAITPISTSRGCPYSCNFCSVSPMFGRKYRFRSADSVIEELSRSTHHHIFFYDDNFSANKKRVKELLRKMIDSKITPNWTAQAAVDIARDEEVLALMQEANCSRLCIGFESMDEDTLKSYNKKQTPDDIRECLKLLHKYHIKVHGMFISEGYSDIYKKLGIDSLQISVLMPLVGSRLYTSVKDAGKFISQKYPTDWAFFDGVHVVHWPEKLTPFEMQKQTIQSLKDFYSRGEIAKLMLRAKFNDGFVRVMGYRTIRKWESQNREFMTRLRQISLRDAPVSEASI